jgi:hypothetical protein
MAAADAMTSDEEAEGTTQEPLMCVNGTVRDGISLFFIYSVNITGHRNAVNSEIKCSPDF